MNLVNLHQHIGLSFFPLPSTLLSPHLRFQAPTSQFSAIQSRNHVFYSFYTPPSPILSFSLTNQRRPRVSLGRADERLDGKEYEQEEDESEDLGPGGEVFQKTLRLVECSMFASVTGLAYFLSNSLALENYFGCFFSLPIVISSMRWGLAAGRKTMVATAVLLFVLSGPLKASTYLLMHGLVGLAMGSLWRLRVNWGVSLALCTLVRLIGVIGYIAITSFLIRENILNLITINVHATLTYALTAIGVNAIPTMDVIYAIFGTLLILNCGFFVFLLHVLYSVFLTKLGMKDSLALPRWLEKAI